MTCMFVSVHNHSYVCIGSQYLLLASVYSEITYFSYNVIKGIFLTGYSHCRLAIFDSDEYSQWWTMELKACVKFRNYKHIYCEM